MTNEWKWRQRLQDAVEKSGKSMRKVSMGAGLSEGYLHGVLSDGKEMTIGRLMSICSQLNVTSTYILHGIELSADDEEILRELNANPDTLGAVRAVLNAVKGKG